MKMTNLIRATLLIIAITSAALAQDSVAAFDGYAERARDLWGLPGMSVVVVKDGKVLMSKGYGVREIGKPEKVDSETLFGAMSTTKAMVAVAMGILVDEGKVAWSDKVRKHLPAFKLGDPYVTSEVTVRDLLTHNAGLGNADFLWAIEPWNSIDEIVSRMQYAKPAYGFRAGFVYHNVMYGVAGKVIEKASGMSYEQFMTKRVFEPLGMKSTYPNITSSLVYKNRSSAHYEIKSALSVIEDSKIDTLAPAGGVWSNSDDMGRWVIFLLGDGKPLLKESTLNEIFKPQVISPPTYPTYRILKPHWTTYGLGWFQHDYRGEMANIHTGSLAGRVAIVGLLRDKKMGVYVFGNADHIEVRHALMYKAFDVFALGDANGRDWSAEFKTLYDGIKADGQKADAVFRANRKADTKPTLAITDYVGDYADSFYGKLRVTYTDGKLLLFGRELMGELTHWQYDAFLLTWKTPWMGEDIVRFEVDPRQVKSIALGPNKMARVNSAGGNK